jgi:YVTN family beta-propeller protein
MFVMTAAYGQTVTANVAVGSNPYSIAVNPITNKIYVTNRYLNTLTVIDGVTNLTATIPTGAQPQAVAVNPLTNKIYVANENSGNVTVIDGATNTTATITTGGGSNSVAVNPVTNKIYVSNGSDGDVTVIDGVTNDTTIVAAGSGPTASAVNTVTNKIYIPNYNSGNVTVIDGATNAATTIPTAPNPWKIAVNPVTNKIYVAHQHGATLTVIDGVTNSTATVHLGGDYANSVAVNTITNKVYIPIYSGNVVTVIDGVTNSTINVTTPSIPFSAAVNPVTNKIYVTNEGSTNLTVIDGATNTTTGATMIGLSEAVVANPITNKVYVVNYYSANVTVVDGATNNTATVAADGPFRIAVNPVTNKIYVGGNSVTVIDGVTNSTATVSLGSGAANGVAVNPATNKIYVASESNNVTVIDGATNSTTTVMAGSFPIAVAVNPVTNKIYVANFVSNNVTVIDGITNSTTTIATGTAPQSIAVNPVTNKIYVCGGGAVVIDGATNSVTVLPVGFGNNFAVAVNSVTNKIYIPDYDANVVIVIDGVTNSASTVAVGAGPDGIDVNPITNKIYTANYKGNSATVIDGVTNDTTTLPATGPFGVAVNPVTNKIYVTNNYDSNIVTVIDGVTNTTSTVTAGTDPGALAVNPVTNKIYVVNGGVDAVTVIDEEQVHSAPLTTDITPLTNNETTLTTPTFTFAAASTSATIPDAVYFQVDTWQNAWTRATGNNPTWTAAVAPLQPGFHLLYAFTGDSREATTSGSPADTSTTTLIGSIQAYGFLVVPLPPAANITANASATPQNTNVGTPFPNALAVTVKDGSGNPVPSVTVTFTAPTTGASAILSAPTASTNASGIAQITAAANANGGSYSVTAAISPSLSTYFSLTNNFLTQTIQNFGTIPTQTVGTPLTLTATATSNLPVSYQSNSTSVCTVSGSTASFLTPGQCSITASQIGNNSYAAASSVTQTFTVKAANAAGYSGVNTTAKGTWTGNFGADGYIIANDANLPPSYVKVSLTNDSIWTWALPTTDPRALQTAPGATTRIASTFYSTSTVFNINVDITDNNAHRISLYLLDWDTTARAQTITIMDATTQAVLDTETFASFQNGEYASWTVSGNIIIQVTRNAGYNSVVAGIFFDPSSITPPPPPPPPPTTGATAAYAGPDAATQGTWTPTYGANGDYIANYAANNPSYGTVSFTGQSLWTWANPTIDPRALRTSTSQGIASTYYGPTFSINVNLTDGNKHRVALYLLDWDTTARAETIQILDAASNTVLDTEKFSNFHNGVYAVWDIKGDVLIQVTGTAGYNGVVAGIFFGPASAPVTSLNTATYTGSDATTEGTWTGHYGSNGALIVNGANTLPAYAKTSLTGNATWTFASSTSDPRALQIASGSASQTAAVYYSSGSSFNINLNLSDAKAHKVSLYLLDWDTTTRAETVTILDAASNTVLNTQSFSAFHNGEYASWTITGNVIIQVNKTAGINAVISGIFID